MLRISCNPLPIRGVILETPTAKATAAITRPRSFHVVDSTAAALRRYEEARMALLADVSIFPLDNQWSYENQGHYSDETYVE